MGTKTNQDSTTNGHLFATNTSTNCWRWMGCCYTGTNDETNGETNGRWMGNGCSIEGCAKNMGKKDCGMNDKCTWKSGYPPLAFSEDSDYQLLSADESFFANMDGSVVNMINDMDSNMLMALGAMFVVVSLLALRQCMM